MTVYEAEQKVASDLIRRGTLSSVPVPDEYPLRVQRVYRFRDRRFEGFEIRLISVVDGSEIVRPMVYHPTLRPSSWREAAAEMHIVFGVR